MMSERDWFFGVGPLDSERALRLETQLQRELAPLEVEVLDHRSWYARALDVDSVRAAIAVLRAGVGDTSLNAKVIQSALGLLSDLETWLDRECDAYLDTGDNER
jgi:hypothetical protein